MTAGLVRFSQWSAAVVAVLLVVAQFIPVDRTNPPVQSDVQAPTAVKAILVKACFDCHSHETQWPWYSRIAPASWLLAEHVREGRKDLNFSRWPTFDFASQDLIMHEIEKQLMTRKMPPRSYLVGHASARLDKEEQAVLLNWVRAGFSQESDLLY